MGDVGQALDIHHIAVGVAHGLAEDGPGAAIDAGGEIHRVVGTGEAGLQPHGGQPVGEQVVGAAVELAGGDDVVAGPADGLQAVGDGGHAGGQGEPGDAAFHLRHPLLQHRAGGVHDAAVDVALDLEIEQVGPVLGVVEGVGGGLVDGHRHRAGGGLRAVSTVDGQGFELHESLQGWMRVRAVPGPAGRGLSPRRRVPACRDAMRNHTYPAPACGPPGAGRGAAARSDPIMSTAA